MTANVTWNQIVQADRVIRRPSIEQLNGQRTPLVHRSVRPGFGAAFWQHDSPAGRILEGTLIMLSSNYLHALLLFWPLSVVAERAGWSQILQFWLSVASIPGLSALMILTTECMSFWLQGFIGGIAATGLNLTVDFIVGTVMLTHGETSLLQVFIIGSIFRDTVFVPGCCYFAHGVRYAESRFGMPFLSDITIWLILSVSIMQFPAIANAIIRQSGSDDIRTGVSLIIAIILLILWLFSLLFQYKTHHKLFEDASVDEAENDEESGELMTIHPLAALPLLALLAAMTFLPIRIVVTNVREVANRMQTNSRFLAFSLFPLIINFGELVTAVRVSYRNKLDIPLSVFIGASLQYTLLYMPVFVLIGYVSHSDVNFDFEPLEIAVSFIAVITCSYTLNDGKSNYLRGLMYIGLYIVVVTTYALLPCNTLMRGSLT